MQLGVGAVGASVLVRDAVATPALRQLLDADIDREVRVQPALAPLLSVAGRIAVRARVTLELDVTWSRASLRAESAEGTRHVQDLNTVTGMLGTSWRAGSRLELGGAAGVLGHVTERRGLFAEGSDVGPALRAHAGARLPFWNERIAVRAFAEVHRFGAGAIRRVGGTDGLVTRAGMVAHARVARVGG